MPAVTDGDCIVSIAHQLGFRDYLSLWKHNETLQEQRPNPNMLVVGDTVEVPPKTKVIKKETGQKWVFKIQAPKSAVSLRIILLGADGNALANAVWDLTAPVAQNGTTGTDGLIKIDDFPADKKTASLKVTPKKPTPAPVVAPVVDPAAYPAVIQPVQFKDTLRDPEPEDDFVLWALKVGSLPSFNHKSGVLARLHNLGSACDVDSDPDATTAAVKAYQKAFLSQKNGSGDQADIQTDLKNRHDPKP